MEIWAFLVIDTYMRAQVKNQEWDVTTIKNISITRITHCFWIRITHSISKPQSSHMLSNVTSYEYLIIFLLFYSISMLQWNVWNVRRKWPKNYVPKDTLKQSFPSVLLKETSLRMPLQCFPSWFTVVSFSTMINKIGASVAPDMVGLSCKRLSLK